MEKLAEKKWNTDTWWGIELKPIHRWNWYNNNSIREKEVQKKGGNSLPRLNLEMIWEELGKYGGFSQWGVWEPQEGNKQVRAIVECFELHLLYNFLKYAS